MITGGLTSNSHESPKVHGDISHNYNQIKAAFRRIYCQLKCLRLESRVAKLVWRFW